jgi:hypothetical protein
VIELRGFTNALPEHRRPQQGFCLRRPIALSPITTPMAINPAGIHQ